MSSVGSVGSIGTETTATTSIEDPVVEEQEEEEVVEEEEMVVEKEEEEEEKEEKEEQEEEEQMDFKDVSVSDMVIACREYFDAKNSKDFTFSTPFSRYLNGNGKFDLLEFQWMSECIGLKLDGKQTDILDAIAERYGHLVALIIRPIFFIRMKNLIHTGVMAMFS